MKREEPAAMVRHIANEGHFSRGIMPPTLDELHRIQEQYRLEIDDNELGFFAAQIAATLVSYRRVAALPEPKPDVRYPRTPGYRPPPEENPLNAWYWRCSVKGAPEGKLAGKRIALKDNICLAGVPMMNGSLMMEGYLPDVDATIVTRILDAGGEIIGKAVCEDLSSSGASDTSATGPVVNPRSPSGTRYSAGGSSSGSAALVANGDCDMAIGADQGGSIRIPSSLCGVCGLKPTHGLVPYTAIFPIENTLDHAGPICKSVDDAALLLEVIAGYDGLDPRQPPEVKPDNYTQVLTGDAKGLKVGVVEEGFGWPDVTPFGSIEVASSAEAEREVDEIVKKSAFSLANAGAEVKSISVPMHREAVHILTPIMVEGALAQMIRGNALGLGWNGHYVTGMQDFFGKSKKTMANHFPYFWKLIILAGEYMSERYNNRYYGKAKNQVRLLRAAYDKALADVDVLVMRTTAPAGTALPLLDNPTMEEDWLSGLRYHANTCAFDLTGHPALTVPCESLEGLPVGMMIIGRRFEDSTVLRVAHAFQSLALLTGAGPKRGRR